MFGKNLRRIRKEQGLTQKDLAEKIALAKGIEKYFPEQISRLENEHHVPTLETANLFAMVLGCDLSDLLNEHKQETAA